MDLKNNQVTVQMLDEKSYPKDLPFDPDQEFPEYEGSVGTETNEVYSGVREVLHHAGFDKDRYGTPQWNPLSDLVKPGMTVFIKPNTVRHYHMGGKDILSIINHASLLRPVIDYVLKALEGSGRIIIGDAQVTVGLFDEAYEVTRIRALLDWYRDKTTVPIECFDLRKERSVRTWMYGRWGKKKIEKDPRGYRFVDLGNWSCFKGIDPARLRIAVSSYKNMFKHHSGGRHEYLFPQSVLDSDVIINLCKLKTHRRTAITLAIKNFMGIPAWKDTLPHFMIRSPSEGGDQYINPSFRKNIITWLHDRVQSVPFVPAKFVFALTKNMLFNTKRIIPFKDDVFEAMWYGNDTLWRTLFDLNRGVLYADREGKIQQTQQRGYFAIIDGIIAGEKDGPVAVDPVPAGVLIGGSNPIAMDSVGSALMGFDIDKIPTVYKALPPANSWPEGSPPLFFGSLEEIKVNLNGSTLSFNQFKDSYNLGFEPHPSWKGHVERT